MDARPFSSAARRLERLGPFAYLLGLFLATLCVLGLSRALLVLAFHERVALEPEWPRLFGLGLWLDTASACYALLLPTLVLLLFPRRALGPARALLAGYFALVLTGTIAMEALTFDYLQQYDVRPDRLFVDYLGSSEVLHMLWNGYRLHLVLLLGLSALVALLTSRIGLELARPAESWRLSRRAPALLPCAALLFLGMRGTLEHRPINAARVAFSGQNLVNQLTLNSSYTALRAWLDERRERSPAELYGRMPEDEVLARVARYGTIAPAVRAPDDVPFQHRQVPRTPLARPRNLVIVLEESLGAEFVGCLGGKPLTPCFDALAPEGLLLTHLYSTGTRTVRGIEAVLCGFLPTPADSVVKLGKSQSNFFTLAGLLAGEGYATDFVYGGEGHFDNMAAFFLANGFQRTFDEGDYDAPAFRGTWGVSDEDLMSKANETFAAHGDEPFFALLLSTSNHSPFEYPEGRIQPRDPETNSRDNTVQYADYALGELFRLAKQQDYWKDTVWLIVADHDERTHGDDRIPVDKFHIPGLILAPDLAPGTLEPVASQIDLAPTVLGLLGIPTEHPMIGRDLLALAPDDPGRAVLQFHDDHGFLVGDRLVVHSGTGAPRCFTVRDGHLEPAPFDRELERDGLAHALLPGLLYDQRRYHLPDPRLAAQ